MAAIEVSCSQCGSGEYRLVDARTGEVLCQYCRNQWIVPELAQKTETEKYLEEQAKRPQVTYDNTSETDKQLMDALSGIANISSRGFLRSAGRAFSRLIRAIVVVVVLVIIVLVVITLLRTFT